ncbi:MAG: proline--tRNA ligase [Chloroflexi bacterium]|nr:proline--tRNA ligase [Chloroflexota bacterium]
MRDVPARATTPSHRVLLRAAMIHQLGAGIYSYMPLAWRSLAKIEAIVAEEMDRVDGQRIGMPVVHPADLWRKSGRWDSIGREMARFHDRDGHDMLLAVTHEEVVTDLVAYYVTSYRDLPRMVYQIQTKFRDEPRSRGGLIRVREFVMKDAYSFHPSYEDLDGYYERMVEAYVRTFRRCGLEPLVVEADVGMMGGSASHEFMLVTDAGEDTLLICDACGYAANSDVASTTVDPPPPEEPAPTQEVATPGRTTIEGVADDRGVPTTRTLKAVFYVAGEELVFVVIRGDLGVNEQKLAIALQSGEIRPASDQELGEAGIVPGYASPIGVENAKIVVDRSVPAAPNLVAGANRAGFHLTGVNYGRDFRADIEADIALARGGDPCPTCGAPLRETRGIEMGHTFKLGTRYSETMDATFLDSEGEQQPVIMASYGIGIGRLLASAIEHFHDDDGILFPASISPYDVHVVELGEAEQVREAASQLHVALEAAGVEVLRDDRNESAGVKFKDADLIGIPLRVTVSPRSLKNGGVELKGRSSSESTMLSLDSAVGEIVDLRRRLMDDLDPERPQWSHTAGNSE